MSLEDGQALTGASPGVDLTIGVAGTVAAGTNGGYVRIYAPNPLEQGSSVSHWSTAAFPDLLMEPFINSVLREDLDLSLTLLKDIGWGLAYIPFPHLTYLLWVAEAFDINETLTGQADDPEGDGISNIEEYFFGGDPNVISTSILPVMEGNDPNLDFTYTRSVLPADLSYAYEVSPDLSGWLEAVEGVDYSEEVVTTSGTTTEQVQLKLIRPSTGGKVFARLRILAD